MPLNKDHRVEAQRAVLDLFTATTGLPIGIWEVRKGVFTEFISNQSQAAFETHCRLVHSVPGGKARCALDERLRAEAEPPNPDGITVCWTGLHNQRVPIIVRGALRAVLLYGEMLPDDPDEQRASEERCLDAARELGMTPEQADALNAARKQVKAVSVEDRRQYRAAVRGVVESLYGFFLEEERLERSAEQMAHDVGIQIVGVRNQVENLMQAALSLTAEELNTQLGELLYCVQATISYTMGSFLQPYRFESASVFGLVENAQRTFADQAKRHGIEFETTLRQSDMKLEISPVHLQQAINNLVQNAVKYSFRGAPDRRRFIRIVGRQEGERYALSIANYGVGILPHEIDKKLIFNLGYKGALTTSEFRSGAGRGLGLVKEIIDNHHGTVQVTSDPQADEGERIQPYLTQFTVTLPHSQPATRHEAS